ncbi:hypothetical protein PTSG_10026 [Salpingoeca rosetta]|uniref:Receptor L-domain domain-containing protein n=1 Tax=Salpingoeca rosetta (strain ATCC 50818 / BSB-021) TaxID=946362 RepID=F2UPA5_SALR5|nr:uncharacterized protein PTSG_10026 [Salpingoeca rosetta]EGD79460.1 hypothetical protein PTSG_10026 [Salpingoeca rosetta]|eukprot:XP_004988941.1 hypothetical protein PTSG_10026 [Salpingoeca rosetta]
MTTTSSSSSSPSCNLPQFLITIVALSCTFVSLASLLSATAAAAAAETTTSTATTLPKIEVDDSNTNLVLASRLGLIIQVGTELESSEEGVMNDDDEGQEQAPSVVSVFLGGVDLVAALSDIAEGAEAVLLAARNYDDPQAPNNAVPSLLAMTDLAPPLPPTTPPLLHPFVASDSDGYLHIQATTGSVYFPADALLVNNNVNLTATLTSLAGSVLELKGRLSFLTGGATNVPIAPFSFATPPWPRLSRSPSGNDIGLEDDALDQGGLVADGDGNLFILPHDMQHGRVEVNVGDLGDDSAQADDSDSDPGIFAVGGVNVLGTLDRVRSALDEATERLFSCKNTTTATLDCSDTMSREAISTSQYCGVQAVAHCCCPTFLTLSRVVQDVHVERTTQALEFGKITEIGGSILARFSDEPGLISSVDFGGLQRVGRHVDFGYNAITSLDLGGVRSIGGKLDLYKNLIEVIDFGALTSLGDFVLSPSKVTTLSFKNVLRIGQIYMFENALQALDFGNITTITGTVNIRDHDMQSLSFRPVQRVGGIDLSLGASLTSLDMATVIRVDTFITLDQTKLQQLNFGALRYIGGSLTLSRNHLYEIDFGLLDYVGENIALSNMLALVAITFGKLRHVEGSLIFTDTQQMRELVLEPVQSIGNNLQIMRHGSLRVVHMSSLTRVGGEVRLAVTGLDRVHCGSLQHVGQSFIARAHLALASLNCSQLTQVGKSFDVSNSLQLTSVDLSRLQRVNDSLLLASTGLTTLAAPRLRVVNANVLARNTMLQHVDFSSLEEVGGSLQLGGNSLRNLTLGRLRSVQLGIVLSGGKLESIDVSTLELLTGGLFLDGNHLTSIAFGPLTRVKGALRLEENRLTHVDFGAISQVDGDLRLDGNLFTTISLANITHINGQLNLSNSPNLVSITLGPGNLTVLHSVILTNTPLLSLFDCQGKLTATCVDILPRHTTLMNCPPPC